jgi:hypothetical protein
MTLAFSPGRAEFPDALTDCDTSITDVSALLLKLLGSAAASPDWSAKKNSIKSE